MNGRKMNPHQGTDIAAPEGTPVKAASNGIVRLSGGNYFYSGNTVVIDHGHRLFTIYAHLKKLPSNRAIMSDRDRSSAKSANRTRYRPAPALGSVAQRRALHARIIITYE